MRRSTLLKLAALSICAWLHAACALAPASTFQTPSVALPPAAEGVLSDYADRIGTKLERGRSAYWLLDRPELALEARLALFDHAERSLDIQYFIWEPGLTGRLLIRRLIDAADRGVRIRLLLDDLTMSKRDWEYVALQEHPLIEIRTFNPWRGRSRVRRVTEFLADFDALNHRMHVKTIVADGHFGMIGGRNIGDRYFGVYDVFVQNDLDVMAAGPMVEELSESFDIYWNSALAYPIEAVARPGRRAISLAELTERFEREYTRGRDKLSMFPLEPATWHAFLDRLAATYIEAEAELVYDLPEADEHSERRVYDRLRALVASARERVILSTAYLIPERSLLDLLRDLVERDVKVIVLTNSLATNNHMIAHTGYRRWRRRLLAAGVQLHELRDDAESLSIYSLPPTESGRLGLHTKAAVVDDRSFVGSPNIDPRSLILNNEIGFFFDSPEMTAEVAQLLERDLAPSNSWHVTMDEEGWLEWTSDDGTVERQPAKSFKQRVLEFFINLLPIKNQA